MALRTIHGNAPMLPARLVVLLRRYLAILHDTRPNERQEAFIEKCIGELQSGARRVVPHWLMRAALMEINECSVVGCSGVALYRCGNSGFCKTHKGLTQPILKRKHVDVLRRSDAVTSARAEAERERQRNMNGAPSRQGPPPKNYGRTKVRTRPQLDVLGLALDVLGLALMNERKRVNGKRQVG